MKKNKYILNLNEVSIGDIETVGGKNASLGEMLQHLTELGVNIPNGFVVTVAAYQNFIEYNNLE
ncbi:MAG: PEP/pyruvate-binding domain-containing protein, partial [Ginsengibacter sp.]